jgi:outer membrane receptor protein involved in Fe transport
MQFNQGKAIGLKGEAVSPIRFVAGASAILLALLLLMLPGSVRAQQTTADVLGTVTDASGAALANAKITVHNLNTNDSRTATTNDRGDYTFSLLPNGHYSLKVEAPGFKVYQVRDFSLSVGDRARLNAKLEVGAVSETVQVSAGEAAALKTDEASVGNTLDEKSVQDLPLNGRNFMSMVDLTAGVTTGTSNGNWTATAGYMPTDRRVGDSISANGKSDQLNNHEVDGFDNNERAIGLMGLRPSMDGIQEIKVDTSSYAAESGRTAGAVTNVITKAGANSFHGSAYEYIRNDIFDASDYFAASKPELRLNEFGGSLGGPIQKDKTFFFFDIEEDREVQGLTYTTTVPTDSELATYSFSDTLVCPPGPPGPCTPSVPGPSFDPTTIPQVIKNYWSLLPAGGTNGTTKTPGGTKTSASSDNWISSPAETQNSTTLDGRVDHRFKNSDQLIGRYAYNPVTTHFPGPFPYNSALGVYPNGNLTAGPSDAKSVSQQLQLTYTHLFSSTLVGEVKAGYTRINIQSLPFNYGKGADAKLGFPDATAYDIAGLPATNTMTAINFGTSNDSAWLGDAPSVPYWNKGNTYQYQGTLTWTKGAHNFKFGGGFIRRQINFYQTGFAQSMYVIIPVPYSNPFMNFVGNNPGVVIRQVEMVKPLIEAWEPSFYAQDSWRATPSLTLNLGVRYDVFTPYTEAHGNYSNFDLSDFGFICGKINSYCTGKQSATLGVNTDYKDFSPRVGFAQTIGSKTVVRGAFGMTYFPPDVGNAPGSANFAQNENPPYYFAFSAGPGAPFCVKIDGMGTPSTADECAPLIPVAGSAPGTAFPRVGIPTPSYISTATALSNSQVTSLTAKMPNLRSSYLEQWNLSLQRSFGPNNFTIAYVGDVGRELMRTVNAMGASQPTGTTTPTTYVYTPAQVGNVTSILKLYNGNDEHYNALQLVYSLRSYKGLDLSANYVWAHGLGDDTFGKSNGTAGMLPDDTKYDFGNQDLDVRQRFTVHGSYILPFAASTNAKSLVGEAAKGWQLNLIAYFQTGLPFTVTSAVTNSVTGYCYTNLYGCQSDRPNQVAKSKLSHPTLDQWFNIQAFQAQPIGTTGSEGVNQVLGPHDRRIDLSLQKDFALFENAKLEFRAESFNILNMANFAPPGTAIQSLDSSGYATNALSFGKITSTAWGENPRQFQFALKLLF